MSTAPQEEPAAETPPQPAIPLPPPEAIAYARQLAVVLGETEEKPIIQIARAVDHLGQEKAKEIADEAQRVYAGDGLLGKDKATGEMRKRTLGGTFFRLVRDDVGEKKWRRYIKPVMKQQGATGDPEQQFAIVRDASANWHPGTAKKVEITLTGRPTNVQKQPTFIALSFIIKDTPVLPKGMPTFRVKSQPKEEKPADKPEGAAEARPAAKVKSDNKGETRYLVLIAPKQWAKVEESITKRKDDQLVIKGFSMIQPSFSGIVVLGLNVNSIAMMRGGGKG
jgi:hypothetical protein